MFTAKPASLRRKSFGGQKGIGIWWRKSSSPPNILSEEDEEDGIEIRNRDLSSDASTSSVCSSDEQTVANQKSESAPKKSLSRCIRTADEAPILRWDDDLCRPIYHRSENYSDMIATVDSFDEELVRAVSSCGNGIVETSESDDSSTQEIGEDLLQCSENAGELHPVDTKTKPSPSETNKPTDNGEEGIALGVAFQIPSLSRKRTRTFGNRAKRQRPLSLILTHDDEEESPLTHKQDARRVSLESCADPAQSEEEIIPDARTEKGPKKGRRSKKPRSNDPTNSLEKAREYFANLDQTQPLTLDATLSPAVSSRVTRTRRRTNLASPGITREYKAYADSITGDGTSGLSPLSMKDYVSSRKLHFQNKGELVDGFLDD